MVVPSNGSCSGRAQVTAPSWGFRSCSMGLMAQPNIAKDVFIPKLQMDYLDDQQNVFKLSNESVKSYVDESLKVLVAQSRRSDFSRSVETSYSSQSDHSPLFKRSAHKGENEVKVHTPRSDIFRPPKSPRDKASAITQSPRYQIKYQISVTRS